MLLPALRLVLQSVQMVKEDLHVFDTLVSIHNSCTLFHCKHSGGTVAQCVALLPHSKKVVGSSPASCNMSGLVPGPICVEFACSPRVHPGSPHRTPTIKTCKKSRCSSVLTLTKSGPSTWTWSPGAASLAAHCSWMSLGEDARMGKMQRTPSTVIPPACVHVWTLMCACRVAIKRACPPGFIFILVGTSIIIHRHLTFWLPPSSHLSNNNNPIITRNKCTHDVTTRTAAATLCCLGVGGYGEFGQDAAELLATRLLAPVDHLLQKKSGLRHLERAGRAGWWWWSDELHKHMGGGSQSTLYWC